MNHRLFLIMLLIGATALLAVGYANAASITATISAQQSGVDVLTAPQGTTIQLVSSCSVIPSALVTGTVSYQYSADGVTWGDQTPIETYTHWDGAEQSTDFVLADAGSYVFFIDVVTEGAPPHASASQFYPSTGTFTSEPPLTILPEAPPIAGLAVAFAAVAVFTVATQKRKPTS